MKLSDFIYHRLGKDNVGIVRKLKKSINTLCKITVEDLTLVSYQDVKHNIPDLINTDQYEMAILRVLQSVNKNITLRKVNRSKVRDRMLFIFWIQEQYKLIEQLELRLVSSPSSEMVNAGIHTLNVLGDINLIDILSGGDVHKWEKTRNMPYGRLFEKQYRTVLTDTITDNLEKNRKNKIK